MWHKLPASCSKADRQYLTASYPWATDQHASTARKITMVLKKLKNTCSMTESYHTSLKDKDLSLRCMVRLKCGYVSDTSDVTTLRPTGALVLPSASVAPSSRSLLIT